MIKNKNISDDRISGENTENSAMRDCMDLLLSMPAAEKDRMMLSEVSSAFADMSDDEINNMLVVNAALIRQAKTGNISAVRELRSIIGDDERSRSALCKAVSHGYIGIPAELIAPPFAVDGVRNIEI